MKEHNVADPFYGLPVTIHEYGDGTLTFEQSVTGKKCRAYISNEMVCIPFDYFYSPTITAREAANKLEVSKQRINQLCEDGTLHSVKIGKARFVSQRDVIAYAITRKGRDNA